MIRFIIYSVVLFFMLTNFTKDARAHNGCALVKPVKMETIYPNTVGQSEAWPIECLNVKELNRSAQGDEIIIALIDTGIDSEHTDLKGRVILRKDFTNDNRRPTRHGTHIAGIISAIDNNVAALGIAPGARLMDLRALSADETGTPEMFADAIRFAAVNGAHIINISVTLAEHSENVHNAIKYANSLGCLVVAAAGNTGDLIRYPAKYSEVLTVGASDRLGFVPSWSYDGEHVDINAPGVGIYSTLPNQYFGTGSGTTQAAAVVSALAAILISYNDIYYANPSELKKDLKRFANPFDDIAAASPGIIDISEMMDYKPFEDPEKEENGLWGLLLLIPLIGLLIGLHRKKL